MNKEITKKEYDILYDLLKSVMKRTEVYHHSYIFTSSI